MPRRCIVAGCGNTTKNGVSLHIFPKQEKTRKLWIRNIKMNRKNWHGPSESSLVCGAHFTADMFRRRPGIVTLEDGSEMRRDLHPEAVPTIFPRTVPVTPTASTSDAAGVSCESNARTRSTPRSTRRLVREVRFNLNLS